MSPDEVLAAAVASGDPPAAQCCVLLDGRVVHESAHGCALASVFDVASVTKVAATTSALARLVAEGAVALDDSVRRFLPGAAFDASLRALLGHRSGLPAWRPLFVRVVADPVAGACFSRDAAPPAAWARARTVLMQSVLSTPAPTPGRREYSDLGFLALGAVIEAVTATRLDRFCEAQLFRGRDLGFVDLATPASWLDGAHVLATGTTRPRAPAPGQEGLFEVPSQQAAPDPGRVDDDNAYAMGGVAGHAGLFTTARALAEHAHATWIEDALGATRAAFLARDPADGPPRALGWDVPTPGSSAGALGRGARVFGHLGYTGCSLWVDLDRRLVVTLLTNRTLPGRERVEGIRALRPAFHDAVAARLGAG